MAKRGSLSDFRTTKAPAPASETTTPAASDPGPPKAMTLRLNVDAWRTLKLLALDDGRTAHALMLEAVNDYFEKRGKGRVA